MYIETAGDRAMAVRFGATRIDPTIHERVLQAARRLQRQRPLGVNDIVTSYASLLLIYDPLQIGADAVKTWLTRQIQALHSRTPDEPARDPALGRTVQVPVRYDPEEAPDLAPLAKEKGLSVPALIALHTAPVYRCYALGFRPGFPFLGGLDSRLSSPRLSTPRLRVPAGAVGIGGPQTGIYSTAGPGGWRIIGHTSLHVFDPHRPEPFAIRPGDAVRFVAVGER